MSDDLIAIKADIAAARQWAHKHFNVYIDEETTPSHLLASPTMLVEFPEPDIMYVCAMVYGKPVHMAAAKYKLCWKGEHELVWNGNFVLRKELFGEKDIIELRII